MSIPSNKMATFPQKKNKKQNGNLLHSHSSTWQQGPTALCPHRSACHGKNQRVALIAGPDRVRCVLGSARKLDQKTESGCTVCVMVG